MRILDLDGRDWEIPESSVDLLGEFRKARVYGFGNLLNEFQSRRRTRGVLPMDVVAWVQKCRVSDRPDPIPLTCYGLVYGVGAEFTTIRRMSRGDARDTVMAVELARRVGGS